MQCQICKKHEATIHLTEITEGLRSEMHLCERCAVQQGIAAHSHIPLNELLSGLLSLAPTDDELFGLSATKLSCPHCGFTWEQFHKKALLGCPYDYEIFQKQLATIIEKAHDGKTAHCGKVPSKTPQDTKKQMELYNLQQQLQTAVQNEDYELAAKLRDRIRKYET